MPARCPGGRRRYSFPGRTGLDRGQVPEGRDRIRALSIFTAVTMGGSSLGLVLGGLITQLGILALGLLYHRADRHRSG